MNKAAVLGSGIVGLWTAYLLCKRGVEVEVISDSHPLGGTSSVACSVLTPFLPGDPSDPSFQHQLRWAEETLDYIRSLPRVSDFLQDIDCYEFGANNILEADFDVSKLEALTFSEFERYDLSPEVDGYDFAIQYHCSLCDPWIFMPWIASEIESAGGRFTRGKIESIDMLRDVAADIIFNCMGHHTVFPDVERYPVFGQSMFVPAIDESHNHFGLGAGDHGVFHHRNGTYIGSYFVPMADYRFPRRELYQRSVEFLAGPFAELCESVGREAPAVDLSRVTRLHSGIRPFRKSGPRVEADTAVGKTIIHNYGHGAHGWTLGYGSSLEAIEIALTSRSANVRTLTTTSTSERVIVQSSDASDIEKCAELMSESPPWNELFFSKAQCLDALRHEGVRLYLYREGRDTLAFLASIEHGIGSEPLLAYMLVQEDHRSTGIGTDLIKFFEEELHGEADNLYLFVSDTNTGARRLYRRLGYEQVGVLPNYNLAGRVEFLLRKTRRPRQERYMK